MHALAPFANCYVIQLKHIVEQYLFFSLKVEGWKKNMSYCKPKLMLIQTSDSQLNTQVNIFLDTLYLFQQT